MKHPRSTSAVADRRQTHQQRIATWCGLMFGLVLLAMLALPAHAADDVDPPDRVGRLSELNGQVWIFDTQGNEWIAATRNRPVTTGDRVSTEADGRAEVRVGSTVLRIAPNTELEVLALDDSRVAVQLHSGSVAVRLKSREAADQFSLTTGEGRFRAERTGSYRFDRVDDTSHATALAGQLQYEADGTALPVQAGQRVEFWKDNGSPQYSTTQPARDDFSKWVASLDSRDERSVSTRYVSAEMTGVEDLDRYGRWEAETEYGAVWVPRNVAPGWAPYRMGHWAWVSPWGWTWVDDAPWGFAPFHYGRWVYHRNAWGWAPGRYVARPVYAPALVAWVGRPGVSVSVTVGSRGPDVGWFPLGPREVYVPGYRVSPRYVRNVNVTHVTHITNVTTIVNDPGRYMADTRYVNRGNPRAVTVVPAGVVERRQPVAPAVRQIDQRTVREMERQRPRADAPVVAPPRAEAGVRPVADPRTFRPREARRDEGRGEGRGEGRVGQPGGPGQPGREVGNRPPAVGAQPGGPANTAVGATPPDAPRVAAPRDDRRGDGRDERRDARVPNDRANERAGDRTSDRTSDRGSDRGSARGPADRGEARAPEMPRIGGRERPAPVSQPAPAAPVTPPAPPPGFRGNAPERAAERAQEPDRAMAPRNDERRRHHEMPGPPQRAVQAPERPVVQPQAPQVQAPQVQAPQPPRVQAPAPVMRQPEVRQPEVPRVQREAPQPRVQQQEVRQPRVGAEERGGPRVGEERGGGGGRVGERRQER